MASWIAIVFICVTMREAYTDDGDKESPMEQMNRLLLDYSYLNSHQNYVWNVRETCVGSHIDDVAKNERDTNIACAPPGKLKDMETEKRK